jgi:type IV pilus assembly protein PilM
MARSPYVWGIDIGKCALKALRCRVGSEPRQLSAEAFDYIEYPMLLSQPEADPAELVRDALAQFVARNSLKGDKVAVSVAGQLGLTKFIKLPPIESKKIPDIVKYEARQQIPFPLEQVVWDWQRLAGGLEEAGFVVDAEVALFAIKSEQIAKSLAPLTDAGIAVDILQMAPVALANMVMFDQLPDQATVDPEKPPPSIVLVSMGVDSTDLVITNGLRIWQRSMSIGGSTFTKAVVKEMKLTFAKAEHLKRNAVRAEDPRAVFAAMRPVFTEFTAELQRSLNYFTGADRTATIGKVLLLGNAAKLRGLSDYVAKQLQLDVQRLETFRGLTGPAVLQASAFRDNRLAFGTTYGLAVQAANAGGIHTNLLPRHIMVDRLIESKKPWAAVALTGLLVAALVSFAGTFMAWKGYAKELYAAAFSAADQAKQRSQQAIASLEEVKQQQQQAADQQKYLVMANSRRFQALDMLRAVESLLPSDEKGRVPAAIADRREIHIDRLDCQYFPDLAAWFAGVKPSWAETHPAEEEDEEPAADGEAARPPDAEAVAVEPPPVDGEQPPAGGTGVTGPTGPGWVIELAGHHFHNENHHKPDVSAQFVRSTLVKNLLGEGDEVLVSAGPKAGQFVPVKELGIGWPVIVASTPVKVTRIPTGKAIDPADAKPGRPGDAIETIPLRRYDFVLQFTWQPTTPGGPKPPPPPAAPPAEAGE